MGPIWGRQDPGGPHVGPMNLAIWMTTGWSWPSCPPPLFICLFVFRQVIFWWTHISKTTTSSCTVMGFLCVQCQIYISVYWVTKHLYVSGILPKGPYPPCVSMADRALLAGYPRCPLYTVIVMMIDMSMLLGVVHRNLKGQCTVILIIIAVYVLWLSTGT